VVEHLRVFHHVGFFFTFALGRLEGELMGGLYERIPYTELLEASDEPSRKYALRIVDDAGGVQDVLHVGMRRQGIAVWLAADDGEFSALLGNGSSGSIRLMAESIMVGRKIRVAMVRPDSREYLVWTVRVLWTVRLRDGLYENGAAILETGQANPSFRNQSPPSAGMAKIMATGGNPCDENLTGVPSPRPSNSSPGGGRRQYSR
jgi:hypothetical protein